MLYAASESATAEGSGRGWVARMCFGTRRLPCDHPRLEVVL